jgi:hypothetical protein
MKISRIAILSACVVAHTGCETAKQYATQVSSVMGETTEQLDSLKGEKQRLRLESNKPGTAFCLAGKPVVAGDPGVTVQAGDRVYIIDPAPKETTTVVAAQAGYFAFVDDADADKVRLQFNYFARNGCTSSSAGRTCVTYQLTSDLKAFEAFCANFP